MLASHTLSRSSAVAGRNPSSSRAVCVQQRQRLLVATPARQQQHQCRASNASAALSTQLALHLGDTTVQMPFTPQQAQTLDAALSKLLQTFAEMAAAEKRKRWDPMEVRFTSESGAAGGLELLEVFCNPNTYKSAFDAKLMITARAPGLKVVCEGRLSSVKADVDAFIKDHCD